MSRFAPAWRMPLALAAAYLLVLQMVVVGFTLGAQAAPAATDLHDILCTTSGDHGGGPDESLPGHLDCCTQGCPMLGSLGIAAPPAVAVSTVSFVIAPEPAPSPDRDARPSHRQDQRSARGPPGAE